MSDPEEPIPPCVPVRPDTAMMPAGTPGWKPSEMSVAIGLSATVSSASVMCEWLTPTSVVFKKLGVKMCWRLATAFAWRDGEPVRFRLYGSGCDSSVSSNCRLPHTVVRSEMF